MVATMSDDQDTTPTLVVPEAELPRTMLDPHAAGPDSAPGRGRSVRRRLVFALGVGAAATAAGIIGGASLVGSGVPAPPGRSVTGPPSADASPPPPGTAGPTPGGPVPSIPTGAPTVDEDERERREKDREQREKDREQREKDREERERERAEEESEQG